MSNAWVDQQKSETRRSLLGGLDIGEENMDKLLTGLMALRKEAMLKNNTSIDICLIGFNLKMDLKK